MEAENKNEKIKKLLRNQARCNNCKYGVFAHSDTLKRRGVADGHCTYYGRLLTVKKDSRCPHWEPFIIDPKTLEEFEKFRKEIAKY